MDVGTPQHQGTTDPNNLEYALASLGRTTISNEHLRAENASLRAQLDAWQPKNASHSSGNLLLSPAPSIQDICSTGMVSSAQHDALARQYAELEASHAALKAQNELIRKKLKDSKILIKQWQVYLRQKKQKEGQKRERESISTPPRGGAEEGAGTADHDVDMTPRASADVREPVVAALEEDKTGSPEMTSSPPHLTTVEDRDAPQANVQVLSQTVLAVTSSQATADDIESPDEAHSQAAPSSDFEPVVISTRCLKRKLGLEKTPESPVRRVKQEHNSPSIPIDLQSRSSQRAPRITMDTTTSSDDCLDNFGPAMLTPRRPKRVNDLYLRATSEEVPCPAPRLQRSASSLSDGASSALAEEAVMFLPDINNAVQAEGTQNGKVAADRSSRPSPRRLDGALMPLSVNVPRQQRTAKAQPKAKVRRTGARDKILLVSEDGEDGFSQNLTDSRIWQNAVAPKAAVDDRLDDLLNGPSPERISVLPNLFVYKEASTRKEQLPAFAYSGTPEGVVERTSPVRPTSDTTSIARTPGLGKLAASEESISVANRAIGTAAARRMPPLPVRPEEEPLRIRPASSLRLEDFKINPKYMGTDFAFADTIRGRDARQNLHACTRADCCGGALEKVIKMGGTAMSGRTDADALKAFVGPAWQALIGAKKPNEAKQLVQQAHAFCFANEHGKHRQAFERRSTPPGYWRADFPTTQEQAVDRKTADDLQRKEVEARHREAMRECGRWIFRDE